MIEKQTLKIDESSIALGPDGYPVEECEMNVLIPDGTIIRSPVVVKFKPYEYDPYKVDEEILPDPELKGKSISEGLEAAFDKYFTKKEKSELERRVKNAVSSLKMENSSYTTKRIVAAFNALFSA